jgi:hypothetical protein
MKIDSSVQEELILEESLPEELTPSGHIQASLPLGDTDGEDNTD